MEALGRGRNESHTCNSWSSRNTPIRWHKSLPVRWQETKLNFRKAGTKRLLTLVVCGKRSFWKTLLRGPALQILADHLCGFSETLVGFEEREDFLQ